MRQCSLSRLVIGIREQPNGTIGDTTAVSFETDFKDLGVVMRFEWGNVNRPGVSLV